MGLLIAPIQKTIKVEIITLDILHPLLPRSISAHAEVNPYIL